MSQELAAPRFFLGYIGIAFCISGKIIIAYSRIFFCSKRMFYCSNRIFCRYWVGDIPMTLRNAWENLLLLS